MTARRTVWPHEGLDFRGLGGLVKRVIHPSTVGSRNLGVSICYLHPGEEVRVHQHDFEEAYFVLQGIGTMTLEGHDDIVLRKDLSVYVPSNALHGQRNTGDEPLVILCSLSPAPPLTY